jgi:predicted naringenin-chalcone synthase
MSTLDTPTGPVSLDSPSAHPIDRPVATLCGIGLAVPAARTQVDLAAVQADAWGLSGAERARWQRIVEGSSIERRHVVADPERWMRATTAERMCGFEEFAPELAHQAASRALQASGIEPHRVTDLVFVTCTGFAAPGVGTAIAPRLGLSSGVRQTQIGFMGCFGGILGLRAAIGAVSAEPNGVALVVCVELCSLHLRAETSPQNLVASALFADGAAAAVVAGGAHRSGRVGTREADHRGRVTLGPLALGPLTLGPLTLGYSRVLHEARDAMTWRITDTGFAMTLTREVPAALEREIAACVSSDGVRGLVIHPGGPGIIDAVERGLHRSFAMDSIDPRSFEASRAILREYGNMSSGSVLFVLDRYLRDGGERPLEMVAFGPGVSIETLGIGSEGVWR